MIKKGDLLECIDPGANSDIEKGKQYVAYSDEQSKSGNNVVEIYDYDDKKTHAYYSYRFKKVEGGRPMAAKKKSNKWSIEVTNFEQVDTHLASKELSIAKPLILIEDNERGEDKLIVLVYEVFARKASLVHSDLPFPLAEDDYEIQRESGYIKVMTSNRNKITLLKYFQKVSKAPTPDSLRRTVRFTQIGFK